jgi:hypothetical protein
MPPSYPPPAAPPSFTPSGAPPVFPQPAPLSPGPGYAVANRPTDSQATLSLVFGLLSLTCCLSILGPVAFFLGNNSLNRIRASGGTLGGEGLANAGRILGIIGSFILVAWVLLVIVRVFTSMASISTTG